MKRFFLFSSVMMVVFVFSFGTVLAQDKLKPLKVKQTILVSKSMCENIASVKNDGTMPETSPVQHYRLVCENKGQKVTATMEVIFSKEGVIKEAKMINGGKTMGSARLNVVSALAVHDHCIRQCTKNAAGDLVCVYVCVD